MNIKSLPIIFVALTILGLCSGCAEDFSSRNSQVEKSRLTIYIPDVAHFSTRTSDETAGELKCTSLFFFAFPSDESKTPTIKLLSSGSASDNSLSFEDTYKPYNVDLEIGDYYFYLCANIYDADIDISTLPQTKTALESAIYNIPEGFACQIPAKGLPMSASHTDFFIKNEAGSKMPMTSGEAYHYDGKVSSIYASLTFLYSKVTIIAWDAFENHVLLSDIKFTDLSKQEPIIYKENFFERGSHNIDIPAIGESDSDADRVITPESYTFYIPERYVDNSDPTSQSKISFTIGEKNVVLPLGESDEISETSVNTVPSADAVRKIVRGTHYTYTLRTLLDITLEVEDWTPEEILAKLNGPVYLHVEKQIYEVVAGSKTAVWFASDAENVHVKSPTFKPRDGEPLDVFKYSIDELNDTIRIWLNPDIKSSDYDEIKKGNNYGKGDYDYFHIVAGPINKRISVYPFELDYYLHVSPQEIPIDVGVRIASGEYEGSIPVTIRTNYPKIKVTLPSDGGWNDVENEELTLQTPQHDVLTVSKSGETDVVGGEVVYDLYFKGLNSGYDIWKNDKTLTFQVDGIDPDGAVKKTETVKVKIIPMITNYKIHFKPQQGGWNLPHIYVYQCLEFPADWPAVYNPGPGQEPIPLASKPIGYRDFNGIMSALEYSFTGAIAFRGWNVPANYNELYYKGTELARPFIGTYDEGFFVFPEGLNKGNSVNSWNIQDKAMGEKRYSYDMDFCKEYRDSENACDLCHFDKDYNKVWPGIVMEKEDNGWYVFELTGIATPGKALIMFADYHSGGGNQFPGSYKVGVPLFDFPSKEGWLLFNGVVDDRENNQFLSTNPELTR